MAFSCLNHEELDGVDKFKVVRNYTNKFLKMNFY